MKITYETLFERIENDPLAHLGGYSPHLIYSYFTGYDQARRDRGYGKAGGRMSLQQFGTWFSENVYSGPQNFASICLLNTDTDEEALGLFFEFRKSIIKEFTEDQPEELFEKNTGESLTLKGMILHEAMRTRPAMYFGNSDWMRAMWAYCSGYLWAEPDLGITDSEDRKTFTEFQEWLNQRFPIAQGANWGKIFSFLGLGSNQSACEQFYEVFELFLEGAAPDAQTKRIRDWIQGCLASVEEMKAKGEL